MATLTVTLQESVVLNGCDYGSINSASVADVGDVYKRNVTCIHSNATSLAKFASSLFTKPFISPSEALSKPAVYLVSLLNSVASS